MALKDNAVITAAVGYVFVHDTPGTAAPTPAQLTSLNPETFGSDSVVVKVSGTPTSYTLIVEGDETAAIPLAANAATVQAAVESLASVGPGNVVVSGVNAGDAAGLTIEFVGELAGEEIDVTEGTYVGGTAPDTTFTNSTANGWHNIGHTSRDDMPEFGFDGGDTEVKGTWQKKRLREVATGDPVADSVVINLQQWDKDSLELYYGVDSAATDGVFGVSGDFAPLEKALLIIIVDGDVRVAFYAPKASIKRDDSIDLPVDEFASIPIKATFLNMNNRRLYDWISEDLFSAA